MDLYAGMTITVTAVLTAEPLAEAALLLDGPDNSFEPAASRRCHECYPGSGLRCFAAKGHRDEHVAYSGSGTVAYRKWAS